MTDELALKKERFAVEFVRNDGNASDAYRAVHDTTDIQDESVHQAAYRYLKDVDVKSRIEELKAHALEYHKITIESLVKDMADCRDASKTAEDHGNWRLSNVELAKMTGQYEEKSKVEAKIDITIKTDW